MQPLILGGDHSITYAPLSALAHFQDLCLVWFDAHTDFSPWCGRGSHDHKQVLRRIYALDRVRRIVQIGHRGITSGDERRLGSKAVVVTSAVARSLRPLDLLSLIPDDLPCYISIDIDVIDPLFAPGTAAPVPDGLSPEVVRALLACIIQSRKVAGVDIVEVNPRLDVQSATVSVAAALVRDIAHRWGSRLAATPSRPDASANAPPSLPPGE
jgi:agmatinase